MMKRYRGDGNRSEAPLAATEAAWRARNPDPSGYLADAGLVNAVNVALLLNQPLLMTGEPGTGKSELAGSVAWELGLDKPLKFRTKSTSTARDLFYTYDSLARFHAAQTGEQNIDPLRFIRFNALGLALLLSNDEAVIERWISAGPPAGGRQSVVLIDEIDKAPRDFPNDLLNEIEENKFTIPELGHVEIARGNGPPPIVIITSNSEKDLPDAFLRRCVYYHVPFPDSGRMTQIVDRRLGSAAGGATEFLQDALELFYRLRRTGTLRKPPATAEFLGWVAALRSSGPESVNPLAADPDSALTNLGVLIKTEEDQAKAQAIVRAWIEQRRPPAASS